nr:MAG TPA_asm: hypothetical protein [Caudoviricetes sp.]
MNLTPGALVCTYLTIPFAPTRAKKSPTLTSKLISSRIRSLS